MSRNMLNGCALLLLLCFGCAEVDVTKTSKGFYAPTNPNDIDILQTKPDRPFEELGSVSTSGFAPSDTAQMHNAMREKAAPLGANAVIIINSGQAPTGTLGGMQMWSNGVAIRWREASQSN
jgi:hypothetical protein